MRDGLLALPIATWQREVLLENRNPLQRTEVGVIVAASHILAKQACLVASFYSASASADLCAGRMARDERDGGDGRRGGSHFQARSVSPERRPSNDPGEKESPPSPPQKAGKPVFFDELGKPLKDLFTKGFSPGHMLAISCLAPGGTTLTTSTSMTEGSVVGLVAGSFKRAGVTTEISAGTLNQISVGTTYEDVAPGLKLSLTTIVPDSVNYGKAQIHYQHDYVALTATLSTFKSRPCVALSTNVGSQKVSIASSVSYSTESKAVTGITAGVGFSSSQTSALLLFTSQTEKSVDAYGMQALSPDTTVGLHLNYQLEKQLTKATLAGSYKLDSQSTLKGRIDSHGIAGALLQYEPDTRASLGISAEVDTKCLTTAKPKIGLTFSLLGTV